MIACFRAYVTDEAGEIHDYKSFLTTQECQTWAARQYPTFEHTIVPHVRSAECLFSNTSPVLPDPASKLY